MNKRMRNGVKGGSASNYHEIVNESHRNFHHHNPRKSKDHSSKRKAAAQQNVTMPLGITNGAAPYANGNPQNLATMVAVGPVHQHQSGSSRSHSKHGTSRKSHSIKHKSSKV